ncbi:sugar MFS transporter [Shewanella insulae]|uniref:sugar MFS transporter n=1 Tax=Shewanella insulae TaxID=2681496 RepID=UPI001EFE99E9|nr:sugar MFS transporter [Shewanella insulae]MCG9714734.1 sugar MFS transporter [Shewanella insulae]MCG9754197.1 sugar MFS transporter [Shewanella insulae]
MSININSAVVSKEAEGKSYQFALTSLTFLFFIWGFITCLNDVLIPHLKQVFELSYVQASLVQFCFFGAYFIVSIPAGALVHRLGFQQGIVVGLTIAAIGCLLFYPAAELRTYPLFLAALFVLASGITLLQVAANPFVTALGKAETASSRLTMTQAFNAFGTAVAPQFGALLILGAVTASIGTEEYKIQEAQSVQIPYLLLASVLLLMAAIFAWLRLPKVQSESIDEVTGHTSQSDSVLSYRHLVLGAIGIFVYVGGEVSIGSYLVSFMGLPEISGLAEHDAGRYLSYYWGGAMVGRFIGAIAMQKIAAGKALAFNAMCSVLLILIAICTNGALAMWALLAVGLCNSIMFPTIFSLALAGLGRLTSNGSGVLCAAIVGGALVPVFQGFIADVVSLQLSFVVPMLCYLYIGYYGLVGHKVESV